MGTTSYSGGAIMEALGLFCNHKRLECHDKVSGILNIRLSY